MPQSDPEQNTVSFILIWSNLATFGPRGPRDGPGRPQERQDARESHRTPQIAAYYLVLLPKADRREAQKAPGGPRRPQEAPECPRTAPNRTLSVSF